VLVQGYKSSRLKIVILDHNFMMICISSYSI
jgi:hypothetical protein